MSCCGGKDQSQPKASKKPQAGLNVSETSKKQRQKRAGAPIEGKIVLLGESGVGKSSIAMRFCHERFEDVHDVTIGGAYLQKTVLVPPRIDTNDNNKAYPEQQVKLHIWDTGGSEKFRSMI